MSDLALHWDGTAVAADLAIEANDVTRDDGLQTAVLLSLFTDRLAEPGDPLPAGAVDRRGWWADAVPVLEGDRIGSRLWLLAREKQTSRVAELAQKYAIEALQWLIQDGVASAIGVEASFPRPGMIGLAVHIDRPHASGVDYRFGRVWDAAERPPSSGSEEEPIPSSPIVRSDDVPLATSSGYLSAL